MTKDMRFDEKYSLRNRPSTMCRDSPVAPAIILPRYSSTNECCQTPRYTIKVPSATTIDMMPKFILTPNFHYYLKLMNITLSTRIPKINGITIFGKAINEYIRLYRISNSCSEA